MVELNDSQKAALESDAENVVITAPAGSGKALKNGTKVITSLGWKNIEDLTTEDLVFGSDGKEHKIIGVFPQGKKDIYKVNFSDGNFIECSGDHYWNYQLKWMRDEHKKEFLTNTTEYILKKEIFYLPNGAWNIYIPETQPVQFTHKNTDIDPYLLGFLLGDGCLSGDGLRVTIAEKDLLDKVKKIVSKDNCSLRYAGKYDYQIIGPHGFGYNNVQTKMEAALTNLKLKKTTSETKFIPEIFKHNDIETRLAVLQGLIDTDGCCAGSAYDICLKSRQLILDIKEICESLGFTAVYSEKESVCYNSPEGIKDCGKVYRLYIKTSKAFPKIHTSENKEKHWSKGQSQARRTIRSIEKENYQAECTCIAIDSPDHLYLTENFIPTHNTEVLRQAIILYRKQHPTEIIDAITYTRAATAELRDRLAEEHILDVNISTIHVWSRERLKELALMYGFEVKVLEKDDIMLILRQLLERYPCKVKVEILYSYVTGNKKMDVSDGYAKSLDHLDKMYIAYKRNNSLYDFTDYPLYLLTMLKKYNEHIMNTDALFVDELQDVDDEQRQLFELVKARKKFYIGDSWQAIYFFRGADSGIFDSLDDFKRYKLTVNYRSFQEILDYADTFYIALRNRLGQNNVKVSDIDYSDPSGTSCERGKGGIVYLTDFFGQTEIIKNRVMDDSPLQVGLCSNNKPIDTYQAGCDIMSGNYFILCRTNKQVKSIQDLGFTNVSTVHQAKGLEYDNVLMTDIEVHDNEDLNIAYVAATRARNKLMVMNYNMLYRFLLLYRSEHPSAF